ncbi:MAG TPA: hypothetical protein VMA54_12680 [Steroidobacteraceae bacterium]|nr:hypothetical protein [Steroidobacteraceae bacterium]
MTHTTKILLQTTIPSTADDWSIARFGQLAAFLRAQRDRDDRPAFEVIARDRDPLGHPDSVLSNLDRSDFDELWLFAVDAGDGLTQDDCKAITRFRQRGGGLMVTRDHMDLGSSVCSLAGVGDAHHFHTRNIDRDAVLERDDPYSINISWPNFHSGANGDYQTIKVALPAHPVLRNPSSPTSLIRFLPAHPHEGAVSAPSGHHARVIASGASKVTARPFNIAVAFEAHEGSGGAIAQSSFHHFADYNWDPRAGAPSFVDEPPGSAILLDPDAMSDTHRYVRNVALWLGGRDP